MAERRAHDPFERLRLVGVAAEGAAEARIVEDERCPDDGNAAGQCAFDLQRKPPALRRRRLEQRIRACCAQHLGSGRANECGRSAVQHGLGGSDHDDDIGANECGVDTKRDRTGGAELDEVVALDVVHFDMTVEPTRELRRDQRLEQLVPRATRETRPRRAASGSRSECRGAPVRPRPRRSQPDAGRAPSPAAAGVAARRRSSRAPRGPRAPRAAGRRAGSAAHRGRLPRRRRRSHPAAAVAARSRRRRPSRRPGATRRAAGSASRLAPTQLGLGKWVNLERSHRRRTIALERYAKDADRG